MEIMEPPPRLGGRCPLQRKGGVGMPDTFKSNSRNLPITSAAEVRHLLGPLTDAAVAEILRIGPSLEEVQVAARHMEGAGDLVDRSGHTLSGRAAKVYEILSAEDDDPDEAGRRA
jgi:hypothetical protein